MKKNWTEYVFVAFVAAVAFFTITNFVYWIIQFAAMDSQIERARQRSQIEKYLAEAEIANVDDASKSEGFGYIDMPKAVENNTVHTPDGRQAKTTDVVNNGYVYWRHY